jgi:hypothetical protein
MRFPSFVPPDRIIEEYEQVLAKAVPTSAGLKKVVRDDRGGG